MVTHYRYESLILLSLYGVYVVIMKYNERLKKVWWRRVLEAVERARAVHWARVHRRYGLERTLNYVSTGPHCDPTGCG